MTREEQLEEHLKKSHQRYERLVGIVKDGKTADRMEDIDSDFDDAVEDLKELEDLPDVDIVIVVENGSIRDVYGFKGTTYKVVDTDYSVDMYGFQEVREIGDLRTLLEALDTEE